MSSYAACIMGEDESVIYSAKPHWITFITISGFLTLFILPWVHFITTEIVVTNKRVIYKTGLIVRDAHDINFNSTEMIELKQGICGRLLNYGDINLIGNGGKNQEFKDIADPLVFRKSCSV